jgi:glutathione S-transferase
MNHEHGYAFAVAMAGSLQLYYWAFTVGGFRRKAGIAYPIMSATKEEAEKDQNKHLFNCAQRVHYSSLEVFPPFITLCVPSNLV